MEYNEIKRQGRTASLKSNKAEVELEKASTRSRENRCDQK